MFNLKYIKTDPTNYILKYSGGKLRRKGEGLSLWYYAPTMSLVSIPMATTELPFIFNETTNDFQEVSVQGQVVYRVADPEKLAGMMNFTLDKNAEHYVSEDPIKLENRMVNLVQVKARGAIEELELRRAIRSARELVESIKSDLQGSEVLATLGIEIIDLNILAIKPTPETARALEARVREAFLEEADVALYRRRNASIEQERAVKENELRTELAIEEKQREIEEAKLQAERALLEQRREMEKVDLEADITQEEQRKGLVDLATENLRKEADARAYEISTAMEAYSRVDVKVLEAMSISRLDPQQLLALGIRELAGGADKIGQLNLAPDLLQAITGQLKQNA